MESNWFILSVDSLKIDLEKCVVNLSSVNHPWEPDEIKSAIYFRLIFF